MTGCGRCFMHRRGCSWSSSEVLGSESHRPGGRDAQGVFCFSEWSLALLLLPEAGIEHRLKGRCLLQIIQSQRRPTADSSGDLWQNRSYHCWSSTVHSEWWLQRRKACGFCPFLCAVVTVDHSEACIIFNHSHLLFESTSLPQEHSEPRPVVTFLSCFKSSSHQEGTSTRLRSLTMHKDAFR